MRLEDAVELVPKTQHYIGVDPAFGSSKFSIVMVCTIDYKLCVLESIELDRQDFNYCVNKVSEICSNMIYQQQKTLRYL
jgi:hypothetical protein